MDAPERHRVSRLTDQPADDPAVRDVLQRHTGRVFNRLLPIGVVGFFYFRSGAKPQIPHGDRNMKEILESADI